MSAGRTTKVAVGITAASTAVGAVAGVATAAVLAVVLDGPRGVVAAGAAGFGAAAARLAWSYRKPREQSALLPGAEA